MAITDTINEIIDRRIGRHGFEGKGHLEVIKKKNIFNDLNRLMDEYSTLRETILSQINEQKGEYYVMSVKDPSFQERVELTDGSIYSGMNILDTIGWLSKNINLLENATKDDICGCLRKAEFMGLKGFSIYMKK